MSRTTRFQYREQHPIRRKKHQFTYQETMDFLKREMKRKMIADGVIVDPKDAPPKYEWDWEYQHNQGTVSANTRGEARSKIKVVLGISKNKRLPINISIVRRTPDANRYGCFGEVA